MSDNTSKEYKVEGTPSMEETLTSSIGNIFNRDEQPGDKLVKIILSLINSSIDIGVGMTLGTDVSGRTIDDVKNELLKKLILIKELAKDPFIQEKVGEAAKEVIDLSIETLDEVEKPLNEIIDRLLLMISDVANKSIRGSLEVARGVAQSALAEVPVVGGLVDLALTTGIAFNRIGDFVFNTTDHIIEGSESIGKVVNSIQDKANTAYNTYSDVKNKIGEIASKYENIKQTAADLKTQITEPFDRISSIENKVKNTQINSSITSPTAKQKPQSGGRNKKINEITERIYKRLQSM
jgi:prefoldin subunit 5